MSRWIPLIRAGVLTPMRRWLDANRHDTAAVFEAADLGWVPADDPAVAVPLFNAVELLVATARLGGPDVPWRMMSADSPFDLGFIGMEALKGPTLREGFARMARHMPQHCTHEILTVARCRGGLRIGDGWAFTIAGDEALHLVQQYSTAVVAAICGLTEGPGPTIARVGMVPHPEAGLAHLRDRLGDRVEASRRRMLRVDIPESVADRVMPQAVRARAALSGDGARPPLRGGDTLFDAVASLAATMLPATPPTIDRVARMAGMSRRTLQRRLADEGRSFSQALDSARARIALARLRDADGSSLRELAEDLGYADQATLTRAVQRWTGRTPTAVRAGNRP